MKKAKFKKGDRVNFHGVGFEVAEVVITRFGCAYRLGGRIGKVLESQLEAVK